MFQGNNSSEGKPPGGPYGPSPRRLHSLARPRPRWPAELSLGKLRAGQNVGPLQAGRDLDLVKACDPAGLASVVARVEPVFLHVSKDL